MPARFNSGTTASRMRPLGSARISFSLADTAGPCRGRPEDRRTGQLRRIARRTELRRVGHRMLRPEGGRPGLAEVLQMAGDGMAFQAHGGAAGEDQGDGVGLDVDGQQLEDAPAVLAIDALAADV